jgi:hypothetical protein
LGGGMMVTVWRQRGQSTLNGSVGSRSSSNVKLIAHCGQLAIIASLPQSRIARVGQCVVNIHCASTAQSFSSG